jgi:uracil-DNA glycosylase
MKSLGFAGSSGVGGHGGEYEASPYRIINSYHCSRLNTNTGRLTTEMFEAIFARARELLTTP